MTRLAKLKTSTILKKAEAGDKDAQYELAKRLYDNRYEYALDGVRTKDAATWYIRAADQGHSDAQYFVSDRSSRRYSILPYDTKKSYKYLKLAAEQGHVDALLDLGDRYFTGQYETKINRPKALDYWQEAAEQGNYYAQKRLIHRFDAGELPVKHCEKAVGWLEEAAKEVHYGARLSEHVHMLGRMYRDGTGVKGDHAKSFMLFERAVKNGNDNALYDLANAYFGGYGVKQDTHAGMALYTRAALRGNADAQNKLGVISHTGENAEKDYEKAFEWYEKAARKHNRRAISNLKTLFSDLVKESADDLGLVGTFENSATGKIGHSIILAAKIAAFLQEIEPTGKSVVAAPANDKI